MNDRERDRALETRRIIYNRAGQRCEGLVDGERCGAPLDWWTFHMAHIVPKSKANLRKYGKAIIHHQDNMAATCGARCNDSVLIGCNPVAEAEHVRAIYAKVWGG